jgi:hypothetical protein
MTQLIIYNQDNGVVAVVRPTDEALIKYGIDAIAQKDVPSGRPYKIIDASELPADRAQRSAWTVDDADLTDGVGAEWDTFDEVRND